MDNLFPAAVANRAMFYDYYSFSYMFSIMIVIFVSMLNVKRAYLRIMYGEGGRDDTCAKIVLALSLSVFVYVSVYFCADGYVNMRELTVTEYEHVRNMTVKHPIVKPYVTDMIGKHGKLVVFDLKRVDAMTIKTSNQEVLKSILSIDK